MSKPVDPKRVYVSNLDFEVNARELKRFFVDADFDVVNAYVPQDQSHANFRNKGFGFVEFNHADDAEEAIEDFSGQPGPRDRAIRLKVAEPRP